MIKADIYIRTYDKDLKWLKYCLESIHKFDRGFNNIIVCIPEEQKHLLSHLTVEKVVTCKSYENDYVGQQIEKLRAFLYTDAEYILFTDSDSIFSEEFSPEDFMMEGKPVILKENYDKFIGMDAYCWKERTEKLFGEEVKYEYMRRQPFFYRRDTLININFKYLFNENIIKEISEFNFIGAFCDKYENDKYTFLEVGKDKIPLPKVKQYWSHSGLTKEEEKEIQSILSI